MSKLTTITGIRDEQIELLEAVGYVELRHLKATNAKKLLTELEKANDMLGIVEALPDMDELEGWIAEVKGDSGAEEESHRKEEEVEDEPAEQPADTEDSGPDDPVDEEPAEGESSGLVDFEADPDVLEMLDRAPLALPIPNRQLAERGIPPSEVAIAPVLNRAQGDLDVRVSAHSASKPKVPGLAPKSKSGGLTNVASYRGASKRGIDASLVRTLDDARSGNTTIAPLPSPTEADEDDRIRLLRTARESTNRGKNPESRQFVRGVLHDRGIMVWFGCVFMILFQCLVPLALIAAPLLILSDQKPESFEWVPGWIIAFPIALPIVGLLCLLVSCRVKCRVCGQKVLMPRQCRKNVKAHHVPGLGYVLPLAVHTIVFRWFNCTFCGTSVRIKE
ncbi:MAG: DUF4332 domain-containing protein [Haloferula sp.]